MKFIVTLIMLVSTTAFAAPPKPIESEYLLATGGGFLVSREEGAFYAMNFSIIKDLPAGYKLNFSFENPKKGAPAIENTQKLEVEGVEIIVQSPYLECVRNRKKYKVIVDIYSDDSESEKLGRHTQKVEFNMPKEVLKQFGIASC